jgi:pimeloyl-ACP methyl ester carboxylesterase
MVTEQHINGTYYKYYQEEQNKHLLFLLPGQSLSPRAFWEFKLPEGKTHVDYFVESGIDVILFDPVGYGNSKDSYPYNRNGYAEQIKTATNTIHKEYICKTLFGFSSTTAPALISGKHGGFFDKVIIHSPCIRNEDRYFIHHGLVFSTNMHRLKEERISKVSDRLIPKSNKIDNWDKSVIDVIGKDSWEVPSQVVYDINNFWFYHKQHGFDPSEVSPIMVINGEYDFEVTGGGYDVFKSLFPSFVERIVPNSTHFSMWENNSNITREYIINYCLG